MDAIVLDFSKAFETVPRKRLLYKPSCYTVRGENWFGLQNFLPSHHQSVVIDGTVSGKDNVISSVPQDAVLGLLLFWYTDTTF